MQTAIVPKVDMRLRDLIFSIDVLDIDGPVKREINGLAYDAGRVQPGDVYFALQRGSMDGHEQIEMAIQRGAIAVVCRHKGSMRQGATKIEVLDTRLALAQAASAFYGTPADRIKVIGISGVPGQWHMAFLLKQLLESSGVRTGLIGSVRHEIGRRILPAGDIWAEPSDVQQMLAAMHQHGCAACVIEIPAGQLTEDKFVGIPMDVFIHAGGFDANLARWINAASGEKSVCSVINIDEGPAVIAQSGRIEVQLTYGLTDKAELRATDLHLTSAGSSFMLEMPGHAFRCDAPLVGRHNIYHLLGAAGAALSLDFTGSALRVALGQITIPPGNMERVAAGEDVFVDEARTVESLRQVLASAHELPHQRILALFGCPHSIPGKTRYAMGELLGEIADHVVLTADNPGREPVEQICSAIAQGIDRSPSTTYHLQADRTEAIHDLVRMRREGDIVLILGKGARTYQECSSTIVPFDDCEVARAALELYPPSEVNRLQPLAEEKSARQSTQVFLPAA